MLALSSESTGFPCFPEMIRGALSPHWPPVPGSIHFTQMCKTHQGACAYWVLGKIARLDSYCHIKSDQIWHFCAMACFQFFHVDPQPWTAVGTPHHSTWILPIPLGYFQTFCYTLRDFSLS